jgi:Vesicle transport v-SNARE protein N-terminus
VSCSTNYLTRATVTLNKPLIKSHQPPGFLTVNMDTDIGTELFAGYENDFNIITADISSKIDSLKNADGKTRTAAINAAERALEEAQEIVSPSFVTRTQQHQAYTVIR